MVCGKQPPKDKWSPCTAAFSAGFARWTPILDFSHSAPLSLLVVKNEKGCKMRSPRIHFPRDVYCHRLSQCIAQVMCAPVSSFKGLARNCSLDLGFPWQAANDLFSGRSPPFEKHCYRARSFLQVLGNIFCGPHWLLKSIKGRRPPLMFWQFYIMLSWSGGSLESIVLCIYSAWVTVQGI